MNNKMRHHRTLTITHPLILYKENKMEVRECKGEEENDILWKLQDSVLGRVQDDPEVNTGYPLLKQRERVYRIYKTKYPLYPLFSGSPRSTEKSISTTRRRGPDEVLSLDRLLKLGWRSDRTLSFGPLQVLLFWYLPLFKENKDT